MPPSSGGCPRCCRCCAPATSDPTSTWSRGTSWLARDPGRLGTSLEQFVGHPAYNISQLRQDLDRFTFLLGADDGESLFGPDATE